MVDKLFYVIFNKYYENGHFKKGNPVVTTGGIFTICLVMIFKTIDLIVLYSEDLYVKLEKPNPFITLLTVLAAGSVIYFVFFFRDRHMRIYEKFSDNNFLNSKLATVLGFATVIALILSMFIVGFVRHLILSGYI